MATTTLIVGAGASVEYGLPTGPMLQQEIVRLLRPGDNHEMVLDNRVLEIWSELPSETKIDFNTLIETCRWIASALPLSPSIDSFLETHSAKDPLVGNLGKFAIARVIAECEQNSVLNQRDPAQLDFAQLGSSWIGKLWGRGLRGVSADHPYEVLKDYKIITFNYDRCIEQCLRLIYQHFFRTSADEAQEFAEKLDIVHVYGSLGQIKGASDFGLIQSSVQALQAMASLRTYSEQVEEEIWEAIGRILEATERVIFLGFSFAKINTDLLRAIPPPQQKLQQASIQVLGTSHKMSPWDAQAATGWANAWLRGDHHGARLEDTTAANFFISNSITF